MNNEGKNRAYNEEDYIITIDMAKEICMIQRSDIGKEFRKYFIECEKQLKEVKQKPSIITSRTTSITTIQWRDRCSYCS